MRTRCFTLPLSALASAASLGLLAGCAATPGYVRADRTGARMSELRLELASVKDAVEGSLTALDGLAQQTETDSRQVFEVFARSVEVVQSAAEKARARAQAMRVRGEEYFAGWERELAGLKNSEIRRIAEERRAKQKEEFTRIRTVAEAATDGLAPFLSDLRDLRTFLGNDLTVAGIASARDIFSKTKDDAAKVEKALDGLIADLISVAAALTPAGGEALSVSG